jgi:predicted acyltransferase
VVFGVNAIALYVGVGLMARLIGLIKVPDVDGTKISLQEWIYQHLFLSWSSPVNASLAFAICFILVWLGLMWLLYQRKVFIKV